MASNPPQTGQWFYIQSPLSDSIGNTYVANVSGGIRSQGTSVILWPLQPNSSNVLWTYFEGYICSALYPPVISPYGVVLDLGDEFNWNGVTGNYVVLNPYTGANSQQWTFNDDGTISNQSNGLVLDIAGGVAQAGAGMVVYPAVEGPPAWQQWSAALPPVFVPKWSFIQSPLTDDQNNTYVATIQDGTSNVVASPIQANSPSQLWQVTLDGRILSAAEGNPVVTLGWPYQSTGNYIVTAPSPTKTDNTLQWILNDQNMFINVSDGRALNLKGGVASPNTPLITYTAESGPPSNEVWSLTPASPLTVIMAMPPATFPPFTGDEATAYEAINLMLGVSDLRSQYPILDQPLPDFLSRILAMNRPDHVTRPDWKHVVDQLTKEITAADAIRLMFEKYNGFHSDLFADNGDLLNQLGAEVGQQLGDDTNVGGIILSLFEGVLYTVLEAIPGAGPVLGNIMEAGINLGMSIANDGGSISPNPFDVQYSQLWAQLSANFVALLSTMGNMEKTILADWGKMEATYADIGSTGPNSLAWPPDTDGTLLENAKTGYKISVFQMLMPTQYQIYQYQASDDSAVPDVPSNAQWVQSIGNNTWNKYWIATTDHWTVFPDQALPDIWSCGVSYSDFFQGFSGWGFARCYPSMMYTPDSNIGTDGDGLVITITNLTPNPLIVTASPNDDQGYIIGATSQTLQLYGSVSFVGYYEDGLAIDITIIDPNLAAGPSVASFTAHVALLGKLWVDTIQSGLGYQFTTPICNSGSGRYAYPSAIQAGICLVPINPPSTN